MKGIEEETDVGLSVYLIREISRDESTNLNEETDETTTDNEDLNENEDHYADSGILYPEDS